MHYTIWQSFCLLNVTNYYATTICVQLVIIRPTLMQCRWCQTIVLATPLEFTINKTVEAAAHHSDHTKQSGWPLRQNVVSSKAIWQNSWFLIETFSKSKWGQGVVSMLMVLATTKEAILNHQLQRCNKCIYYKRQRKLLFIFSNTCGTYFEMGTLLSVSKNFYIAYLA